MTNTQAQTILELRRRGQTYADIAAHIGGSANTVKSYCLRNEPTLQALAAKEICKHCGAALIQRPSGTRRSFCSDRCRYAWWKAHRDLMNRRPAHQFICLRCGGSFTDPDNGHRKYCSRQCYHGGKSV
ncbi:MAG: RNA polymerase subunit sigma-70 [Oscillospiraceae bacterium]|jgi:endogenous inhibitor of DNA gyrase (YacG/DUF329 family)|nr:RNA polymerase subunit sigma-70 [Oscillospiraceae bacterium]